MFIGKSSSNSNCFVIGRKKRGEWVKDNVVLTSMPPQYIHRCSVCGKTAFTYNNGIQLLSDFCPNCGADMRGSDNGR